MWAVGVSRKKPFYCSRFWFEVVFWDIASRTLRSYPCANRPYELFPLRNVGACSMNPNPACRWVHQPPRSHSPPHIPIFFKWTAQSLSFSNKSHTTSWLSSLHRPFNFAVLLIKDLHKALSIPGSCLGFLRVRIGCKVSGGTRPYY